MKTPEEIQRLYQTVPELIEDGGGSNGSPNANEYVPPSEKSPSPLPKELLRERIENFPTLSEFEVVRHFSRLASLNFSIEMGLYPLGSCTMKYNPKVNETVAADRGFSALHPFTPESHAQGALEVMFRLQEALVQISGMKACSLHPAAGAHGELVGVKMINAYHRKRKDLDRKVILIPDSAHGTNPASAGLSGLTVKKLQTGPKGTLDLSEVSKAMDRNVAALMMTQPNTLGIFESDIIKIANFVHERGGLLYCDGANLNALVGRVDFGKMGVDVMHINLHKTFSTPHGGGGPGAGPVVVSSLLEPFLPIPLVGCNEGRYFLDYDLPESVGPFRMFYGNFSMLVRALCYIYAFGKEGLHEISEVAVLKANYLKARLRKTFHLPYETPTLHEVVFDDKWQHKKHDVTALDMAKRLMDFGFHPPTVYFPLIVPGALMIEPTESEPKTEIDRFVDTMIFIAKEASENPDKVKNAPHRTGIQRLDETKAARELVLTWNK